MRKLATNEVRLLALFSAAIFLALNLFAARVWMQYRSAIITETAATQAAIAKAQGAITDAEAIKPAQEWIIANPPPTSTAEQANTSLLKAVYAAAEAGGIKVVDENFLAPSDIVTGNAIALQIKISGPFASITKFLFSIQNPTAWRSVPKMTIRSETEPPNVLVDMEIRQYYIPPVDAAPPSGS